MANQRVIHEHERLRVGLIGAGYVSTYHIRALQDLRGVEIVGIADSNLSRAEQVAQKFGLPAAYRSLGEMASAQPDVIHVLTPPASHCGLTMDALDIGCHVFVEKPMAETPEECDRMIAKARAVNRILSVNHSARMDPTIMRALELIKQGACGDILAVDFFRSSDYPPYSGGPVPPAYAEGAYPFKDLGVHGLYLLEAFLGHIRTVDIRYFSSGRDPNLVFDEWRVLAECEKGTGQIYLSWAARPMRNELIVHGTRGMLHADCFLQTCVLRKNMPGPKFVGLVAGVMKNSAHLLCKVPLNVARFATGRLVSSPGIQASIAVFYKALREGKEPPVSAAEGRRIVAYMHEASCQANADRKRRVEVERPIPPARILVTGATGFVGRTLMERLRKRGEPIRVLVRRPHDAFKNDPLIHQICGDLGDPEAVDRAVRGVDIVYHIGAAMRGGRADFERGTVWGAKNMVASCLRHSVKRLVYVSSLTVLNHAGHPAGIPVTEFSPLEPYPDLRGFYTQSKLEAEKIVADAARNQQLPVVILRPGQIFGAGAEKIPPSGTIAIAGRWVVVGSGKLQLPLVYVEDVVDALQLAAERDCAAGSIFHLVDSELVSQNEYLNLCRNVPGNHIHVIRTPRAILYGAAILVEALSKLMRRQAPLSRYRLRSARPLSPCDCSAAREKLGWIPQVGTRQGLAREFQMRKAPEQLETVECSPELVGGLRLEQ